MNNPLHIIKPGKIEDSYNMNMDDFVDLLMDHDIDMGVDRSFYDPVLREQYIKKQEAEQERLLELKKKQQQQEQLYFTIDEETGERILKTNVDKPLPSDQLYADTSDLSKELAELGEIADFLSENQQTNTDSFPNQCTDYSSSSYHDQDNTEDIWATQITMLAGPSYDNVPDICMPQPGSSGIPINRQDSADMFLSQIWEDTNTESTAAAVEHTSDYFYSEVYASGRMPDSSQHYMTVTPNSTQSLSPRSNPDSGIDEPYISTDQYGATKQERCSFSQAYLEDVKPSISFNSKLGVSGTYFSTNNSTDRAASSEEYSNYTGSEHDDNAANSTTSDSERSNRSLCRDELRCQQLDIPFTVDMITNYPVEEFNSLLRRHQLNEEQLSLIKDIRRRGKNKVAAQNCRKKKMNELTGMEIEINELKRKRRDLVRDKDELKRSKLHLKSQLDQTYAEVFSSIRDPLGRPYDPNFYSLHVTDEGEARIIPNTTSAFPPTALF